MKTLVALTIAFMAGGTAQAAVVMNVAQVGSGVVITSSGTLDLTGLTPTGRFGTTSRAINGHPAFIGTGVAAPGIAVQAYSGFSGPTYFGPGTTTYYATSATGLRFSIDAFTPGTQYVFVPIDFQSGGQINSTATIANQTIASLGLAVGQYVFTSTNDQLTVNIGAPAVPEPATWGLMLIGFGAVGAGMRRRTNRKASVSFA